VVEVLLDLPNVNAMIVPIRRAVRITYETKSLPARLSR